MKKKISEKYLKEQIKLHENTNYGIASLSHAPTIKNLMAEAKLKSLSDYGAGKKNLQKGLTEWFIKPEHYDYETWIQIGMEVKSLGWEDYGDPDKFWDLFNEWSSIQFIIYWPI